MAAEVNEYGPIEAEAAIPNSRFVSGFFTQFFIGIDVKEKLYIFQYIMSLA